MIGAGIAGINAALKLAEAGTEVYLCESKSYIGGKLLQLDKWFPDDHCGMCQSLPVFGDTDNFQYCLRRSLFHPGINVLLNSKVVKVEGEAGNFSVSINIKSTGIKKEICTGCGLCEQVCPLETSDEWDAGLKKHKAIFRSNPMSLSRAYEIDKTLCNKCGLCVKRCPECAIELEMEDETSQLKVSSIILSTGFEEFDPIAATAFGYRRYPNVITNLTLEQIISARTSLLQMPKRPSDDKVPESVAFLQCVGSRTRDRDYCSVACCMYAVKEAIMLKQARPETEVTIFFMDLRDFGKSYHRYYQDARDKYGIKFIRCRVPVVKQDFRTKDLLITSAGDDNKISTDRFGMVVLSVGQNPSADFTELCRLLGIAQNKWGFCTIGNFSPVETNRRGIYVCGSASGPKDITDTVTESVAAAGQALAPRLGDKPSPSLAPGEEDAKIAVIFCNCREQLYESLNVKEITSFIKTLPGVVQMFEVSTLCHPESQQQVKNYIRESGANRIILAGCSRLMFRELSSFPTEIIDVREQLAWVHQNENRAATEKTKALIKMAVVKLSGNEMSNIPVTPVTSRHCNRWRVSGADRCITDCGKRFRG